MNNNLITYHYIFDQSNHIYVDVIFLPNETYLLKYKISKFCNAAFTLPSSSLRIKNNTLTTHNPNEKHLLKVLLFHVNKQKNT